MQHAEKGPGGTANVFTRAKLLTAEFCGARCQGMRERERERERDAGVVNSVDFKLHSELTFLKGTELYVAPSSKD